MYVRGAEPRRVFASSGRLACRRPGPGVIRRLGALRWYRIGWTVAAVGFVWSIVSGMNDRSIVLPNYTLTAGLVVVIVTFGAQWVHAEWTWRRERGR